MQTIVIIDDEFDARRILRKYIERYFPDFIILGEAQNVQEGVQLIRETNPKLVFLDIKMGDGTGFDLLDKLEGNLPKVIFTTAFDEYALKAFRYHAMDYILKPIDPEILVDAVNQTLKKEEVLNKDSLSLIFEHINESNKKIGIPTQEGFKFIPQEKIIYFEADSSYCFMYTSDSKQVIISKPLKYFEEKLQLDRNFIRPHKSYLVNLKFVEEYQKQEGGFLKLQSGKLIPISRNKKGEILETIEHFFK